MVLVLAVLLPGSEVWYLDKAPLAMLRSSHSRCCTRRYRFSSVQLHRRLSITAVKQHCRCRLLHWAGHVPHMPLGRLPQQPLT